MISGQSQGDAVAAFVQAHAGELNVKYVIWRQRYWEPGGSWELDGGPRLADGEPHGPRARDGQLLTSGPRAQHPRGPLTDWWAVLGHITVT